MNTSRAERFSKVLSIVDVLILGGAGIAFSSWEGRFSIWGLLSLLGFAGLYQVIRTFIESPSGSENYLMRAPEHQFLRFVDEGLDGFREKRRGALVLALVGIPLILITVIMRMTGLFVIWPFLVLIDKLFWQKKRSAKDVRQ